MVSPDFYNPNQDFVGASGVVLFGEGTERALSYVRDTNTSSYPLMIDFAGGARDGDHETPFDTFRRETEEEFGIRVSPNEIIYTRHVQALIYPDRMGWFTVARVGIALASTVRFGDEGLSYAICSLHRLIENPKLIPKRREQLLDFLAATAGMPVSQPDGQAHAASIYSR